VIAAIAREIVDRDAPVVFRQFLLHVISSQIGHQKAARHARCQLTVSVPADDGVST
jgi:hypothetical protein